MRSAIVLIVWLAAGQAQQTGLTSNDCKAYTYREVPARRSKGQLNCSSSSHRDWSRVAIVAHEPYARSLLQDLPSRFLKRVEVLVHKICTVDEPAELIESLSGPNHFIVFSHIGEGNHTIPGEDKPVITSAEVFNRLVMMANADVVILAMKEDILHVNEALSAVSQTPLPSPSSVCPPSLTLFRFQHILPLTPIETASLSSTSRSKSHFR